MQAASGAGEALLDRAPQPRVRRRSLPRSLVLFLPKRSGSLLGRVPVAALGRCRFHLSGRQDHGRRRHDRLRHEGNTMNPVLYHLRSVDWCVRGGCTRRTSRWSAPVRGSRPTSTRRWSNTTACCGPTIAAVAGSLWDVWSFVALDGFLFRRGKRRGQCWDLPGRRGPRVPGTLRGARALARLR
jgi:hypothetical protein